MLTVDIFRLPFDSYNEVLDWVCQNCTGVTYVQDTVGMANGAHWTLIRHITFSNEEDALIFRLKFGKLYDE